jgi:uncharacterized protein (TIGR02118 family)
MIRLVFTLRRKAGLSREEFHDYWLRRHAPLVASFAGDLDVLRYVQTHTTDDAATEGAQKARGEMEPAYDGVAELWWASEPDFAASLDSEPARVAGAALLEDEAKFIDLPSSPLWMAYEYPQINPSPEHVVARQKSNVVRVFFPLRQKAALSEEQARHYWLTHHGPIVRSHGEATGTLCYRQVHRANSPLDDGLRAARGTTVEPYLGHAEAWIDRGRLPATDEARRANRAFIEDEHNFIDMSRSTIFFGKEHVIIDRR